MNHDERGRAAADPEEPGPVAGQMMTLIEGSQGQKTGVTGDPTAGKIGVNGLMTMEGEREL